MNVVFSLFNNSMIWFDYRIIIYNILLFFYSKILRPFPIFFLLIFPPFLFIIGVDCNPDASLITGLDINPFPIFNFLYFLLHQLLLPLYITSILSKFHLNSYEFKVVQ